MAASAAGPDRLSCFMFASLSSLSLLLLPPGSHIAQVCLKLCFIAEGNLEFLIILLLYPSQRGHACTLLYIFMWLLDHKTL